MLLCFLAFGFLVSYRTLARSAAAGATKRVRVLGVRPLPPPGQGVFFDIGAGTGKPVIGAALLHDFARASGVEYVQELYQVSLDLQRHWGCPAVHPRLPSSQQATVVDFRHGDLADVDWSDGDVCFACSTYSRACSHATLIASASSA